MRIVVICDGSDDGVAGLKTLARMTGKPSQQNDYFLTIIAWPVRVSPIWDRAFERQRAVDDLHRAMAEVANELLQQMSNVFSPFGSTHCEYLEGEPIPEIVALVERVKPDLILCGLTRGPRVREVNSAFIGVLEGTSVPAISAFGAPR